MDVGGSGYGRGSVCENRYGSGDGSGLAYRYSQPIDGNLSSGCGDKYGAGDGFGFGRGYSDGSGILDFNAAWRFADGSLDYSEVEYGGPNRASRKYRKKVYIKQFLQEKSNANDRFTI